MQKTIFMAVIVIAASLSIFGQTTDTKSSKMSKTEQDLTALTTEYANALVKRDTAVIERSLADDFMDISPTGVMTSKSQLVDAFKNPVSPTAGKLEAIEASDSKIRVYSDAAVMTARVTWRGQTAKGEAYNVVRSVTLVAVKKNGRWQIVSTQESSIPPPKPATTPSN
jgi:ketosteroid isomerase-like protein